MIAKVLKQFICAGVLLLPLDGFAHDDMGLLQKPVPLKNVEIRTHDGRETDLHTLTSGKITALQMIFTTCTTVCPIQGATFGLLAESIEQGKLPFQLLSISIDASYDTPEDLAKWRARHYDGPGWTIAVSDFHSTHELVDSLLLSVSGHLMHDSPVPETIGEHPSETDHHGSQVMFIGPDSNIVYRSYDYPGSDDLKNILHQLGHNPVDG